MQGWKSCSLHWFSWLLLEPWQVTLSPHMNFTFSQVSKGWDKGHWRAGGVLALASWAVPWYMLLLRKVNLCIHSYMNKSSLLFLPSFIHNTFQRAYYLFIEVLCVQSFFLIRNKLKVFLNVWRLMSSYTVNIRWQNLFIFNVSVIASSFFGTWVASVLCLMQLLLSSLVYYLYFHLLFNTAHFVFVVQQKGKWFCVGDLVCLGGILEWWGGLGWKRL